jgi:hypothetical protein
MARRAKSALLVGILALCAPGLLGCAEGRPDPAQSVASPFQLVVEGAIAEAEREGASDAQLQTLKSVQLDASIPATVLLAAQANTFECFDASGVRYEVLPPAEESGLVEYLYAYETEALVGPLAEECITKNSRWIEQLYGIQPGAVAARDEYMTARLPLIVECLRELGVEVPPDYSIDEIKQLLLIQAHELGTDKEADAARRAECAVAAGVTAF